MNIDLLRKGKKELMRVGAPPRDKYHPPQPFKDLFTRCLQTLKLGEPGWLLDLLLCMPMTLNSGISTMLKHTVSCHHFKTKISCHINH